MRQHLQLTLLEKKMMRISPKWLLAVVMALFCLGVAIPSVAKADSAQLRVGHFVFDAPAVNLYVDETAVVGQDTHPSLFSPMTLQNQYIDFAAGSHTFTVVPDGGVLKSALIRAQQFTLGAGHQYMLAILGNAAASDLHFTLIDETAALAKMDISKSAVTIFINNVYGVPSIDAFFAGKPYFSNLAYGDYIVAQDATEGKGTKVTAHNDSSSVIFQYDDAVGSPGNVFAAFVFSGKFPGTMGSDYSAFYVGQFVGKLTITDAGPIAVGESVPVTFTSIGQRVRYTLTLNTKSTLDIVQSMNDIPSSEDAYLRIKNTAGDTLYENDVLSMEKNAQGISDAGWNKLTLNPGTYSLEAATFVDMGTGNFTLSVKAAQ